MTTKEAAMTADANAWEVRIVEEGRIWSVEARTNNNRRYVMLYTEHEDDAEDLANVLNSVVHEVSVSNA